ncbi:hypothetical protein KUTeg_004627 [Tegillarca granosa]|uniref:Uncharacterized protein n=1 Tax=Tegillarca granosa TaxID=220873 RepID=A0ABQ9FQ16_TEGGR|nr:hypothetical protein KUTeg_004627 [Tegillarca granosa]
MDCKISESTVRGFKSSYLLPKNISKEDEVTELTPKKPGRPKLLGVELDSDVVQYIRDLREAGGIMYFFSVLCPFNYTLFRETSLHMNRVE